MIEIHKLTYIKELRLLYLSKTTVQIKKEKKGEHLTEKINQIKSLAIRMH